MNPKKKPSPAKPEPTEPDEPLESRDDRDEDQDQPEPEQRSHRPPEDAPDLKIVVKPDLVEIDLPRDGNETDTLERIAHLLDEL